MAMWKLRKNIWIKYEMNLNIRELSHLEIDEDIYSQYKLGTLPSFLAD